MQKTRTQSNYYPCRQTDMKHIFTKLHRVLFYFIGLRGWWIHLYVSQPLNSLETLNWWWSCRGAWNCNLGIAFFTVTFSFRVFYCFFFCISLKKKLGWWVGGQPTPTKPIRQEMHAIADHLKPIVSNSLKYIQLNFWCCISSFFGSICNELLFYRSLRLHVIQQ